MNQYEKDYEQGFEAGANAFQEWLMDNKVVSLASEWHSESSKTGITGEILVAVDKDSGSTVGNLSETKNPVWENALEVFLKERGLNRDNSIGR